MNKLRLFGAVCFFTLAALTNTAHAEIVNPIRGLDIGGTLYDVTFHDSEGDTFMALWDADNDGVFGGGSSLFNTAPTFWGDPTGAHEAALAIMMALGNSYASTTGSDSFSIPYQAQTLDGEITAVHDTIAQWRDHSAALDSDEASSANAPEWSGGIYGAPLATFAPSLPTTPVDISGTIKTAGGLDICAMVLASGQYIFSCNPIGDFSLTGLPREQNGTVKRQIYADGFFPKIDILTGFSNDAVVMTRSGICPRYNVLYDPAFVPNSAGERIDISGKVLLQNSQTPICAMVLANGQHMFTCDGSGNYSLNIPLDAKGQFKLQVYADGFAPTIQKFDEFKATNDVRMARATECQ